MDSLLNAKITPEITEEADRFILQIIKHKSISLGEESCKILANAKVAWMKYLATKDLDKSQEHFDEFGEHLKELFKLNYESKLL